MEWLCPIRTLNTGTSLVQPEGNATIHTPANAFKHHSAPLQQRRLIFSCLECSHVYYFFIPVSAFPPPQPSISPPKENKPESTECAVQKSRLWRPAAKGHAVVPASLVLLVDIRGAVYFFRQSGLCIRCIVARGFVFKA